MTGEVLNSEGKDNSNLHLYSAPWAITLMAELYNLTDESVYLEMAYKAVKYYYGQNGEKILS